MTEIQKPNKTARTFVEFSWGLPGEPQFVRVWDGCQRQRFGGEFYESEPRMEVEVRKHEATFNDELTKIKLPVNTLSSDLATLIDNLSSGRPFPQVKVRIFELINDRVPIYLDFGILAESESNPFSSDPVVEFSVVDPIVATEAPLNLATTAECQSVYLGEGCYKSLTTYDIATNTAIEPNAVQIAVDLSFIDGFRVTLTANDGNAASNTWIEQRVEGWWEKGSLEADGISIGIRSWARFTRQFTTADWLPRGWTSGKTVMLVPGCQKTPAACLQRNNLANGRHYGFPTPAWNPVLSVGNR